MHTIIRFLQASGKRVRPSTSRFDRYYNGVLASGVGFPTADEARKDLRNYDHSFPFYGWPR